MRRAAPLLLVTTLFLGCSSPRSTSQSTAPAEGAASKPETKSPEASSATSEPKGARDESDDRAAEEPASRAPSPPPGLPGQGSPEPLAVDPKKSEEKSTSKNKRDDGKGAAPMAATTKSLSGRLSSADVEGVVTGAIDRFAKCTTVDLTVEIKAVIGGDGRVVEVKIPRSQPDDPRARDCVGASFKELAFPKSSDKKSSPIAFELNLRRRAE